MTLTIPNSPGLKLDDFIVFIINKIKYYIENNLDQRELNRWTDYLRTAKLGWNQYRGKIRSPSARDIILGSIYNLIYNNYYDKYIIYIDPNVYINDTNITYSTVMALINYGNLSINGYPILNNAYSYIVENFEELYLEYKEEM